MYSSPWNELEGSSWRGSIEYRLPIFLEFHVISGMVKIKGEKIFVPDNYKKHLQTNIY